MRKTTLTALILLSSIFAFTQSLTTTVRIEPNGGGDFFSVILKDYDSYSTVTVGTSTLVIDKNQEIGNALIFTCYENDGICMFEFDYTTRKFRFYSNNKLILVGNIVATY